MKKALRLPILIFMVAWFSARAQDTRLFNDETPLDIKLKVSIREVKSNHNDSVYFPSMLHYKIGEQWDSLHIEVRARGNFRRKECFYPPLRIKIKKEDAKNTIFEGNKNLKLVMPCRLSKDNSLIMKEYVCYKIYEPITRYTFKTRLVNMGFTDSGNKKSKPVLLTGFFIEDDDLVARRHGGKVVETSIHPRMLHDSSAVRHDMFQYLIANTDWSTTFLHNAKVIQLEESKRYIPLAYDFDMSGVVNAPYSTVNAELPITSVRERLFRGFCRPEALFQSIRKEFMDRESAIKEVVKNHAPYFNEKEFNDLNKFIDDFFNTFRSDTRFKAEIINGCRKT
jgi:hypothetical protein